VRAMRAHPDRRRADGGDAGGGGGSDGRQRARGCVWS
jgi:hypothetical protein